MAKYKPVESKKFRKDIARCAKHGYDLEHLAIVTDKIENGERLAHSIHCPHYLKGTNPVETECHVRNINDDWILTYRYEGDEVYFIRTGTHSDLFN